MTNPCLWKNMLPLLNFFLGESMRKPRVVIATREYPPYIEGGMGRRTGMIVEAASKQVDFYVVTMGPKTEVNIHNNIKILYIKPKSYIKYNISGIPVLANELEILRDMRRLVNTAEYLARKVKADILEIVEPYFAAFHDKDKLDNIKTVVSVLHTRSGEFLSSLKNVKSFTDFKLLVFSGLLGPFLDQIGIKKGDYFTVIGNAIKEEIVRRYKLDPEKIFVIPNPFKVPDVKAEELLSKKSRYPIISFLGRLIPRKNIISLIKAFKLLQQERRNTKLVVMGGGPQIGTLKKLVIDLKLREHVIFTGRVSDRRAMCLFLRSWIVTNPSYYEGGQSYSVLEGMSLGNIPVISDIPLHRDIVENTVFEKFMFPSNNINSLYEKMLQAIEYIEDRGNDAFLEPRDIVKERFGLEKISEKIATIYRKIVEEG